MPLSSQPDPLLSITGPSGTWVAQYFEVPEFIKFGGPFRAIVHKQPGGVRQISSMGPDPHPIKWDGIMLSADGAQRAALLYSMYESGDKVTVAWGNWPSRDCIISDLQIDYKANNYVVYRIELIEVDPTAGVQNATGELNALTIQGLLNSANGIAGL